MSLRAGERLGAYEILGGLGAGGMGEVYRARDPRLGRTVAIKVLRPDAAHEPDRLRRFEQEARTSGSLNHPNILAVYDVGSHEGAPYLVTELLEGETLRQRLEAGALPVRKAIDWALQVARGLAAAHDKGIVHRDLTPENLFLTRDGIVKILDFGLARLERAHEPGSEATATVTSGTDAGTVMGTAGYMSPEQVRGEAADGRSDLFAFGVVLYEMVTGRHVFHGDSSVETLNAILKEEPAEFPPDRQIPPTLDRVVRHCLEKKREDRFQSARDLAFELEGLAGGAAKAGDWAQRRRVASGRRRWMVRGSICALVLAATASAFVVGRRSVPSHLPTFRQITFWRGLATSGRFTPNGKTVVYSARWDAGPREIYSVRTDAPESKSLGLPPGQVAGVSSKGELAMLLTENSMYPQTPASTLARVPLSGGTPRPVAERVLCADWAADGERLAVLRTTQEHDVWGLLSLQIEFPVGTVLARQARGDQGFGCPRVSPQGDRLAFGTSDGYAVVETAGGRSFAIKGIPEPGHETWWSWSPDGKGIWFTASEAQEERPLEAVSLSGRRRLLSRIPGALALYDVSREGTVLLARAYARVRAVARAPGAVQEREVSVFDRTLVGDISSDGRFLLLSEQGAAAGNRIFAYLRQTDASPPMRLAEGFPCALSPDGRWAIVIPARYAPVGWPRSSDLRLVPVGAGDARTLANPGLMIDRADWVPDSRRILMDAREITPGRGWRIFLRDLDGEGRREITPEGVGLGNRIPCDGRRIAVLGGLGAGGMGEVYRARDPRLGRTVAIKVLRPDAARDPDRLRRFEKEVVEGAYWRQRRT